MKKDEEINAILLSDSDRQDHVHRLLQQALERARGRHRTPEDTDSAQLHGAVRRKQGYSIPLVVREAKILLRALADCVQQDLLAIQVSYLIPDMVNVWETVTIELEISVKAFVEDASDSHAAHERSANRSIPRK